MSKLIDRTGQRYGRLVVLGHAGKKGLHNLWQCSCDCGNETACRADHLASGATQSCGCLHREVTIATSRTHGLRRTRAYTTYTCAKSRCQNRNNPDWPDYGGRGIQFLYSSVEALVADIGHPPSGGHSIERINVNGHYEPGNCCWATREEQANNRRSNRLLAYQGRTQTIAQWAREVGLRPQTVWKRLNRKWSVEKSLTTPVKARQ